MNPPLEAHTGAFTPLLVAFRVTREDPYTITPACNLRQLHLCLSNAYVCAKFSSERRQVGIMTTFKMEKKKEVTSMLCIEKNDRSRRRTNERTKEETAQIREWIRENDYRQHK